IGISGLKVKDISILRKQLKENGSELKVVKKTLASLALKENKLDFDKNSLKTEVGFIFGFEDEILPAKTVYKLSKTNENLKILGGFIDGLHKDGAEVTVLAQLPSRQELLAKMIGSLSSPASGFVNVLQGNIKGLVLALNAISKNK
ncbi:MAG: 50S ribosomal protein L10, partial [Candidatus Nealsonbacteria bacterium]